MTKSKLLLRGLAVSTIACALPLMAATGANPSSTGTNPAGGNTTQPLHSPAPSGSAAENGGTHQNDAAKLSGDQDVSRNSDDQLFSEMQQFQRHISAMFDQARREVGSMEANSSFDSSVKLTKQPHQYIIRFALPENEVKNAKVDVENGLLRLTASGEKTTPAPTASSSSGNSGATTNSNPANSSATPQAQSQGSKQTQPPEEVAMEHYEQLISLPGPVDASQMKIDRGNGVLTVTLPRKDAANSNSSSTTQPPKS